MLIQSLRVHVSGFCMKALRIKQKSLDFKTTMHLHGGQHLMLHKSLLEPVVLHSAGAEPTAGNMRRGQSATLRWYYCSRCECGLKV